MHVKEQNKRAKRANLPEGRGAKPQVQNGWLGCRLERDEDPVLFGGESLRSFLFQSALPGDNRFERKEAAIVKEMRIAEKKINYERKEVREK